MTGSRVDGCPRMSVPGLADSALLVHVRLVLSSHAGLIGPGMGVWPLLPEGPCGVIQGSTRTWPLLVLPVPPTLGTPRTSGSTWRVYAGTGIVWNGAMGSNKALSNTGMDPY